MCGRYNLTRTREVEERFGFVDWHEKRIEPRFNIAPSQDIVTIVQPAGAEPYVQVARWGLAPFWLPDKQAPPINARMESLGGSRMFRDALRCLIPATGFYEWQRRGGDRIPMHIQLKDGEPFAFAGLWLPGKKGGPPTAAIVTTSPNTLMATIHNRMPAILRREHERLWLNPATLLPEKLLEPYPADGMEAYAVSSLVNSFKNEGPELIQPASVSYTLSFLS
jgi:putative SOS response-associated peptidase YedK